ncbi:MAG: hypothetical protein P8X55_06325, partial [Desulfosarcinaceae bacterium]
RSLIRGGVNMGTRFSGGIDFLLISAGPVFFSYRFQSVLRIWPSARVRKRKTITPKDRSEKRQW